MERSGILKKSAFERCPARGHHFCLFSFFFRGVRCASEVILVGILLLWWCVLSSITKVALVCLTPYPKVNVEVSFVHPNICNRDKAIFVNTRAC